MVRGFDWMHHSINTICVMKDESKPLSYWLNKAIPSMRGTYKIIRTTLTDGTIDKDYFLAIEENDEGEILWQSKKMHISEVQT